MVMSDLANMKWSEHTGKEPADFVTLGKPPDVHMVWIPGGTFLMGSDKHYREEAPAHHVTIDGFWMDSHTVTTEEFRRFVEASREA
jgi:formylglycine-generating enzyme required for sulfatase activity